MKEGENYLSGPWSLQPKKVDYNELKERTIIALDKLGHQKFSSEPGGYSLEYWMKGVNLLLDDFEREVGKGKLPTGFSERRRQLTEFLLKPVDTSSIDGSISELKMKEGEVTRKVQTARGQVASRLGELQKELDSWSAELEKGREEAAASGAGEPPRSILGRLLGRAQTSSAKASQAQARESEQKIQSLTEEISRQRKLLKSIDQRSPQTPLAEEWKVLESIQARVGELEGERMEKVQLVKERVEVTASLADVISKMALSDQ